MVEVYICQLPEKKSQAELEMLSERVPDERQKRIRQFFHLEDAYRAMIGDLLLNHVLQEKTGTGLKDTVIEKNVYGKPFLSDYPAFQYNISHSGKYVVCALHDQPVGIDVEKVQSFDLRIAKHLFTGFEYRDIIHSRNKNLACFEIWTLKESYLKAVGKGLAIPLHSFRVKNMDNNQIEIVDMEKNEKVDFICKQYTIAVDYKLAVCAKRAKKNDFAEYPAEICFDELRRSIGDKYCG